MDGSYNTLVRFFDVCFLGSFMIPPEVWLALGREEQGIQPAIPPGQRTDSGDACFNLKQFLLFFRISYDAGP